MGICNSYKASPNGCPFFLFFLAAVECFWCAQAGQALAVHPNVPGTVRLHWDVNECWHQETGKGRAL